MRKLFLVILSFLVFSIPVFANDLPMINNPGFTVFPEFSKGKIVIIVKSNVSNDCFMYVFDNDLIVDNSANPIARGSLATYIFQENGSAWTLYSSTSSEVYLGSNLVYSSSDLYGLDGALVVPRGSGSWGELVPLPTKTTVEILPLMVGRAVGSIISLTALPILIIILAVLLVPRLIRSWVH